jgi:hypothetical protein
MSAYLDRLKQLEDKKFSRNTPQAELTKLTEGACVSFVSSHTGHIEKKIVDKVAPTEPDFVSGMVEIFLPDRNREIATAIEEQAAEVIAAPLFGGGDRRLTIQTAETQYMGLECGGCVNLVMPAHVVLKGGRRLFQWTCKAGYRPLCAGYGLERVLVAPPECDRHESHTRSAGRH